MKHKRKQFIARLSRALGRDQEMCPAYVEDFDYSHGPQETMFKDLNQNQILTMFKEQCQRVGTKFVETTPDKLGETIWQLSKTGAMVRLYSQALLK